jgi:hypothetical protein
MIEVLLIRYLRRLKALGEPIALEEARRTFGDAGLLDQYGKYL